MPNERSLSAQRTHVSIWRGSLRSIRWVVGLVALTVVLPSWALALCPAQYVQGSVAAGDDSSYPDDAKVCVRNAGFCSVPGYGPVPSSISVPIGNLTPGQSYSFSGEHPKYHTEIGGSVTCQMVAGCPQCSGNFSFTFYSKMGSIGGKLTYMPDGLLPKDAPSDRVPSPPRRFRPMLSASTRTPQLTGRCTTEPDEQRTGRLGVRDQAPQTTRYRPSRATRSRLRSRVTRNRGPTSRSHGRQAQRRTHARPSRARARHHQALAGRGRSANPSA